MYRQHAMQHYGLVWLPLRLRNLWRPNAVEQRLRRHSVAVDERLQLVVADDDDVAVGPGQEQ